MTQSNRAAQKQKRKQKHKKRPGQKSKPAPVPVPVPVPAEESTGSFWSSKISGLKEAFTRHAGNLAGSIKEPSGLTAGGLGIALLGTTALATGLLPAMAAAGVTSVGALIALIGSSDIVVDNAEKIGKKLRLGALLIGTLTGAITSFPELFVSGISAVQGALEIGVGNIVGSNIANIMLVLGATALYKGINTKGLDWKFNGLAMGGATAVFMGLLATGVLNPVVGAGLLGATGLYMYFNYQSGKEPEQSTGSEKKPETKKPEAKEQKEKEPSESETPTWKLLGSAGIGVAALIGAAHLLVTNASTLAVSAGIDPALVALIGVAIGTSLPELSVSLNAAKKGNAGMAVGNVLGSNVFNILMVGGVMSLFANGVPPQFSPDTSLGLFNIAALGGTALFGAAALRTGHKFSRLEGAVALALYAAYCGTSFYLADGSMPPPPDPDIATNIIEMASAQANTVLPTYVPAPI